MKLFKFSALSLTGFILTATISHAVIVNLSTDAADFHQVGAHAPGGFNTLNSSRPAGYTVDVVFTPTAADLTGTTVLWEYGGSSNGASLILVDGVLTTTAKHNSNDGRAPESLNDLTLRPDGSSPGEMAAQSTAGVLAAGIEYNAAVSWDQNGNLRIGIFGANLGGVDHFLISGDYDNWTGNNSISFGTIGNSAGGLGGELPDIRVNDPFDVNDTPVNGFEGIMGDVYFWNDAATVVPEPSTYAGLFGLAALLMVLARRRRSRRAGISQIPTSRIN